MLEFLAKGVFGLEVEQEVREELDGLLDVLFAGRLYYGVHATEGEGDEGRGDSLVNVVDFVGVGSGEAADCFMLDGDFHFGGDFFESFNDERVIGRSVGEGGTFAEFDVSGFRGT